MEADEEIGEWGFSEGGEAGGACKAERQRSILP